MQQEGDQQPSTHASNRSSVQNSVAHDPLHTGSNESGTLPPLPEKGTVVEIGETFIGCKPGHKPKRGYSLKNAVLTLVHRGESARSFLVEGTKAAALLPIIHVNDHPGTDVMTNEAGQYKGLGKHYASHGYVSHSRFEWGRGKVNTNTIEGFYSVFKRGMKSICQHCAEKHLHRYVAKFDFRYRQRAKLVLYEDSSQSALREMAGKHLTYKSTNTEDLARA